MGVLPRVKLKQIPIVMVLELHVPFVEIQELLVLKFVTMEMCYQAMDVQVLVS